MKKKLTSKLLFTVVLFTANLKIAQAQFYLKQAIIANGGIFEFSTPYSDRATVGSYNPLTNTYQVFDTIQVESVQDVVIDTNYAYVAAQDSIVKYNLTTLQREATAYFPAVKKLELHDNYLMVGKWYGTGDYFEVFNKYNLQSIFSISQVNQTVNGMVMLGDTMYVAYNIKGTIDLYPPFGIYADSIGKLAAIHVPSQTFVRDIILGPNAAGAGKSFVFNNAVYTLCNETNYLFKYTPSNNQIDSFNIGIEKYIQLHNNMLYGEFASGIGVYNLSTNTLLSTPSFNFNFVAGAYDFVNNRFYFTNTDYSTNGILYSVNETNGNVIDSINVGISCEAIALQHLINTGVENDFVEKLNFNIYPNPVINSLNIQLLEDAELMVYDFNGNLILNEKINSTLYQINTERWQSGIYILKITTQNDVQTFKIIKN